MSWVDCTDEDTSDGNLQAILVYSSFALYFKLNLFSSVKASLEMYTLTSGESMSQLCILHSTCADIKGISFVIANTHILLWQLFHKRLRSETLFHLVDSHSTTLKAFSPQFQNYDLGISLPTSRHDLLLLLQLQQIKLLKLKTSLPLLLTVLS